jgi:hypothetical protein
MRKLNAEIEIVVRLRLDCEAEMQFFVVFEGLQAPEKNGVGV